MQHQPRHANKGRTGNPQAQPRRAVADAKKAVAQAVDHVKKRIQVANLPPNAGQIVHRIKHPSQKGHGHDDEVLEHGHLVELVGPQAGQHAQRPHHGCAQHGKSGNPQRRKRMRGHIQQGDGIHAQPHQQTANDGCAHIGHIPVPVRQRCELQKHQAAHDLALHQAGGAIGKGVLQHAHHDQARHQKSDVADTAIARHGLAAEHIAKNQQIQHRREHRRRHGLKSHTPKTQNLFVKKHFPAAAIGRQWLQRPGRHSHRLRCSIHRVSGRLRRNGVLHIRLTVPQGQQASPSASCRVACLASVG